MTPDDITTSYRVQDLERELEEANELSFRCSEENVTLRLQLSSALQREAQLAQLLDDIKLYTRLHHLSIVDAMTGLRRLLDVVQ